MTKVHLLVAVFVLAVAGIGQAVEPQPLVLERSIPLAGVSGRIDHMAIDLRRNHLFVAELGNGTVDVVDLTTGKAVHRIGGLKEPQGVGYSAGQDLIVVANAGDGSVRLFRGEDFSPVGSIELGDDADNVRVYGPSGQVFVGYGSGGIAALDRSGRAVMNRVKLAAHPEGFQLDADGHRVFVNIPDARQIAVVDLTRGEQVATWRVPGVGSNFPMALDQSGRLVAVVFRSANRLVLLDARSGDVMTNIETCGDADDVFFDSKRQRIYVSCGEGVLDVMQRDPGGYRLLSRIKTMSGARTSLFVPELDRLFVAARAGFFGLGSDAAILVFRPGS
jgi:DNA-binding beta-propeller fold protein YncE